MKEAEKDFKDYPGPKPRHVEDELHARAWPAFLAEPVSRRLILAGSLLLTVAADYITGPTIRFPALYAPGILLFAWYEGFLVGALAGASVILARFVLEQHVWHVVPWPSAHSYFTAVSNLLMMLLLAWFCSLAGRLTREIRLIWGIIPVCMYCHKIRNDENALEELFTYVSRRSQAQFSHGICKDCAKKKFPDLF